MKLGDYLETLNGYEVLSIHYEGCVGVKGNKVIQAGKVIDTLNLEKAKSLFNEMADNEGIFEGIFLA
jgi:hypothetical protein